MTDEQEEIHVGCNSTTYGIDLVRSGGGMPVRVFQLSWDDVEAMIVVRGQDIEMVTVGDSGGGAAVERGDA